MAWVRFPDGSRRKVERVEKSDAEADLNELWPYELPVEILGLVAAAGVLQRGARRVVRGGSRARPPAPSATPGRSPGPRSTTPGGFWRPMSAQGSGCCGSTGPDRRVEKVFARMSDAGLATSTIDHTWDYLNQACRHALRRQRVKTNPVQDVLLPEARPPKERKALSVEQAKRFLFRRYP